MAVLTGAGVSVESGIPVFRHPTSGLWARYSQEELATPGAFQRDPALVWGWYLDRRRLALMVEPNAAHRALVDLQRLKGAGFTLVTQNIDGLHERAGSVNPIELHGNAGRARCLKCSRVTPVPESLAALQAPLPPEVLPRCLVCGGRLRPDVVWFGEGLNPASLDQAFAAFEAADVAVSVGTSGVVQPAASLAFAAARAGAFVIEVNPDPTPLSRVADAWLREPASIVLPELLAAL